MPWSANGMSSEIFCMIFRFCSSTQAFSVPSLSMFDIHWLRHGGGEVVAANLKYPWFIRTLILRVWDATRCMYTYYQSILFRWQYLLCTFCRMWNSISFQIAFHRVWLKVLILSYCVCAYACYIATCSVQTVYRVYHFIAWILWPNIYWSEPIMAPVHGSSLGH